MNNKNILITGGRGFIGSFLANHYQNQYTVFAPERSRLDFTNSASVASFFETNKIDVVIHTALVGRNNINGVDHTLAQQNIEMFINLWRNRHHFGQLINCGTGNEFDTTTNIENAPEDRLFDCLPMASYGYAKNIVARLIRETDNFTNLRIFGMFHYTENPARFFRKLYNATADTPTNIWQDTYFDFFNLDDFPVVIDHVINNKIGHNDINVAYSEKYLFSEFAKQFLDTHGLSADRLIVGPKGTNNFTANTTRLDSLNLTFKGLQSGFEKYYSAS